MKKQKTKITALLPTDLVKNLQKHTKENTTQSLIIAVSEWLAAKELKKIHSEIKKKPLIFESDFAKKVREESRKRR